MKNFEIENMKFDFSVLNKLPKIVLAKSPKTLPLENDARVELVDEYVFATPSSATVAVLDRVGELDGGI